MKDDRVEPHQHLLAQQQRRHLFDHRGGALTLGFDRRRVRRLQPAGAIGVDDRRADADRRRRPRSPCASAAPAARCRPAPCGAFSSSSTCSKTAGATARRSCSRASSRGRPSLIGCALCDAHQREQSPPRARQMRRRRPGDRRPRRRPRRERRSIAASRDGATPARETSDCRAMPARPAASIIARSRSAASAPHAQRSRLARPSVGANARPRRRRIEHDAAADRHRRRIGAEDEAIAARQHRRRFEAQPHERASLPGAIAAIDAPAIDTRPSTSRGAVMQAHARAVLERLRAGSSSISASTRRVTLSVPGAASVSPRDDVADVDAAEVDRRALAGDRLGRALAVHLHAAHLARARRRAARRARRRRRCVPTRACR